MNRSAYLTTGLTIKIMSRLSKADIVVHGKENIPTGPIIFVMNHFTRIETLLLPYYIYNLTDVPVWSLADASLFNGGLEKFFDMVGVVSTRDPKRDELIVKSLLTGEANWIIFPEGSMIKTKKIMKRGKYMVADSDGVHEPHTGAAALALRAELFRLHLLATANRSPANARSMLDSLGVEELEEVRTEPITIVPVNLTYYPIRADENVASSIASKLMKDIPERMVEELMAEGTMLLSGVDLDVRFGAPIQMESYLDKQWLQEDMARDGITGFSVSSSLTKKMKKTAHDMMQRYMHDIYAMTTVNHEHIFASSLRMYPFNRIGIEDFKRRLFYAASLAGDREGEGTFFLHKSLQENQSHLLTDDRYGKYANFIELAEEKGIVETYGEYLIRDRSKLSAPLSFHRGRIDNPIEIIANEVEPLQKLQSIFWSLAWRPSFLLRVSLGRYLLKKAITAYKDSCKSFRTDKEKVCIGKPFLFPGWRRKTGVVLIHSYLAVPEEVRELATYLRKRGVWVYALRLPGHGTSAEDLSQRKYREWVEAVEQAYVLMSAFCDRVVVGGMAVGGSLALDLAGRVDKVAGVFAVCPPFSLGDYSTRFMPVVDVWNRMLNAMKKEKDVPQFLDFSHGNLHVNYPQNPVAGVHEIGEYLKSIDSTYGSITQPTLIIQASNNPVVDPEGSEKLYRRIGSENKEYCLLSYDCHVLINGEGAGRVHRKIGDFVTVVAES